MKSSITAGLNEKEATELRQEFVASFYIRKRLREMLAKDIEVLHQSMKNEEFLTSSPNWTLIQVDRIAQIKAYEKIIALLEN